MTIPALNRPTAAPRRAPAPARPAAEAPKPAAVRAQAQAAPKGRPEKFEDVEGFKAHVVATLGSQLPAARTAVSTAEAAARQAHAALEARKQELGHSGLEATLARTEQTLERATYPFRPQAAEKRAEAERVAQQAGELAKRIAHHQQQIAQAEGREAARSRDFWWGDNSDRTGWDDLFDGLRALGDAGTIRAAKAKIKTLIDEKVALDIKATTLIAEATALHHQQADAGTIAAPKKARDEAKAALDAALAAEAPERTAAAGADARLGTAKGELARLEGVKKQLMDYSSQFGLITRTKLRFSDWGWQKDLDAFFKSKGL